MDFPDGRQVPPLSSIMSILDKSRLRPCAYADLVRLGPSADGSYVVPRGQVEACHWLLSLGLSDNWEFDKAFVGLNPRAGIVAVDHTVGPRFFGRRIWRNSWKALVSGLTLRPDKLCRRASLVWRDLDYFRVFRPPNRHLRRRVAGGASTPLDITVAELLALLPVKGLGDVFLKMDIEGAEYDVILDVLGHESRVGCLVVEFHNIVGRAAEFNHAIDRLLERFWLLHIHGNNCGPFDSGASFPDTVELTFLNRRMVQGDLDLSRRSYPVAGLDAPNDPLKEDYVLNFGSS